MNIAQGEPWAATAGVRRSRAWWKTFLVSVLLCLVPFVGWSMATHYVMTHDNPEAYAPGKAASAGFFLILFSFAATMIVALIVGALSSV